MKETSRMRKLYAEIQNQLFYMIPENFEKIYLYAAIMNQVHGMPIGEMYFYYFPKGILKKNPVNVYEIPNKFNIEDEVYSKLVNKLYGLIKELRDEVIESEQKAWTNITITIENLNFSIEYGYEDLSKSQYSNYERHIIWRYKYLQTDIHSYSKKERMLIENYLKEEKTEKREVHNEIIQTNNKKKNIVVYDTTQDIRAAKIAQEKKKIAEEAKEKEMDVNQILMGNIKNEEKKDEIHN